MGFSVAAAAAIIFAGGLLCFSIVLHAVDTSNGDLRDARAAEEARLKEKLDSQVTILNGTANGTVVDINFTNSGSTVIHAKTFDVLLNGSLYTANVTTRTVDGSSVTNVWAPGQTLHLVVAAPVSGPANIKLVTDAGYTFTGTVS
jgi:flagellar protein FlaF